MFKTTLSIWDKIFSSIFLIVGCVGFFYFIFQLTIESILISGIFLFITFQGFRLNVFILDSTKLIIRKPWPIRLTKDIHFKNSEIEKIIFKNIKGRFGGSHILIKSKEKDISFQIAWNKSTLDMFIGVVNELEIKLEFDNWD